MQMEEQEEAVITLVNDSASVPRFGLGTYLTSVDVVRDILLQVRPRK